MNVVCKKVLDNKTEKLSQFDFTALRGIIENKTKKGNNICWT